VLKLKIHSYRYADAVLEHKDFRAAKAEIMRILKNAPVPLFDPSEPNPKKGGVKRRKREAKKGSSDDRYFFLPINQKALNKYLDEKFAGTHGWQTQPQIVGPEKLGGPDTGLKGDFKKGRLQVEIQFGNMARWYTDVFKFQLSYALDEIDVAVLVVPMLQMANLIDENVACYERICRELPWAKMSLTLPILVVGVEPKDYKPIRECYERAAGVFSRSQKKNGKVVSPIPFADRVEESPVVSDDKH